MIKNNSNNNQNDSADLVPLDYDMDGDGVSNSDEHNKIIMGPDGKYDTDGDGTEDDLDNDDDNDGMTDVYEQEKGVSNGGWQDPLVYNARYAMLIGGDDLACEYDTLEMYDKLKGYNYLDENIYCLLGSKQVGYANGKVDGAATSTNMRLFFELCGGKITVNDFFYFCEIAHGTGLSEDNDATFSTSGISCSFGPYHTFNLSGLLDTYIKHYARSLFVMSSCGCAYAINQLHGEGRIIITAASTSDWENAKEAGKKADVWYQSDDSNHWAFIHKGCHYHWYGNDYYPGFSPSLGSISNPKSILHAYNKGYEAATNNYAKKPYSFEAVAQISHPQIEANGNGVPGEMSDRDIAESTYL